MVDGAEVLAADAWVGNVGAVAVSGVESVVRVGVEKNERSEFAGRCTGEDIGCKLKELKDELLKEGVRTRGAKGLSAGVQSERITASVKAGDG